MALEAQDRAFMLISGFRVTQMVRAVTELRIPDLVANGPRSSDDLAASSGVQADPLGRILRCLAAAGVFVETDDGSFGATEVSDWFRDEPGTLRGTALMLPNESYQAFGDLMHTLRTGEPAFEHVFGMSRWEQLAQDPEKAAIFNAAMQSGTEQVRDAIASAYDFMRMGSVVDVGGGRGTLIAGILNANPHLRGVVFDVEAGLAETAAYLQREGVGDRCEIVCGSFFETAPAGHDAYLLKSIVHDWKDEKAVEILTTCRRAMKPEARLLVIEQVVPARAEDTPLSRRVLMTDVQMLVVLAGRERTEDAYRDLLRKADLRLTRVIPTASRFQLIEADPA